MGDGVIWKCIDGKSWAKTTVQDTGNSSDVFDAGKIMHCEKGNKWYWNYPMERSYEQYFNATWTQGYDKNGVKLSSKTYGDHPRAGDTAGYIGMWGFDNTAMKKFVADGVIQSLMIQVNYDDPSIATVPTIVFAAHDRKTEPNVASFLNIWESFSTEKTFANTADNYYSTWITLPVANWLNGDMGGVAAWGKTNTAANYARFAGKTTSNGFNGYNTRLFIKVLK